MVAVVVTKVAGAVVTLAEEDTREVEADMAEVRIQTPLSP